MSHRGGLLVFHLGVANVTGKEIACRIRGSS
jgi:hypothetical protein